jgi:hypothetical protein
LARFLNAIEHRVPVGHAPLRFSQERAIVLALKHWKKSAQRGFHVAHKSDLNGIAQSQTIRIEIHLNATRLTGPGIGIDPWHCGTENQNGVTVVHRPMRRLRAEMADSTSGERRVVR